MKQIHLQDCKSTQSYIKDIIKTNNYEHLIISTNKQSMGFGRNEAQWLHFKNALAFSIKITPCNPKILTQMEISILLVNFFQQNFNSKLYLKWPNDILNNEGKKCIGIICSLIKEDTLISGIGINLGKIEENKKIIENRSFPIGCINSKILLSDEDKEKIPKYIYKYVLENRIASEKIYNKWNDLCYHIDKDVEIIDNSKKYKGTFKGIDNNGVAIIKSKNKIKKIISGSLFLFNY